MGEPRKTRQNRPGSSRRIARDPKVIRFPDRLERAKRQAARGEFRPEFKQASFNVDVPVPEIGATVGDIVTIEPADEYTVTISRFFGVEYAWLSEDPRLRVLSVERWPEPDHDVRQLELFA